MIYESVHEVVTDDIYLRLPEFVPGSGVDVMIKMEGLNPAGSIKIKTAVALIENVEKRGLLRRGGTVIESSSGNLGIALAIVCAARGYHLIIVTDTNASRLSIQIMETLGAEVVVLSQREPDGGFLQNRIRYVRETLAADPGLVWTNQYANQANCAAHRDRTARSVHHDLGCVDVLVVGVGTSGTLMGCVEYFRSSNSATQIVGVDVHGSVTFGGLVSKRHIPGLGTSRRPEIFTDTGEFTKMIVSESETVAMCRRLVRDYGLLAGGSTGTVLAATHQIASRLPAKRRIVAISPDLGERYLDTIYSDSWVAERYPEALIASRTERGQLV